MPIRLMLSSRRPVIMHGREEAAWRRIDELSEMFRVSLFPEDISFSRPCVDETVYAGYAARHGRTRTTTKGEPCVSAIRERGLHAAVLGRWYLTGI